MSTLRYYRCPSKSLTHVQTYSRFCPAARLTCSVTPVVTTITTKPKFTQNQLVIESRFKTKPEPMTPAIPSAGPTLLNDPSLQSTWSHKTWVASGCVTLLFSLTKAVTGAVDSHMWFEPMVAGYIGYILADLLSGVYHWGIDNYGDASTPVFGSQIEGFQGHHKWPWTITRRQFANNLHALARSITFAVLPISILCNDPVIQGFVTTCAGCIMFSQQFHAWSHGTKSKLPPLVVVLQDAGVLVSRSQHSTHHRWQYNSNYCIVSGVCNKFLDKSNIFEALEMIIFFKLGGIRDDHIFQAWSETTVLERAWC